MSRHNNKLLKAGVLLILGLLPVGLTASAEEIKIGAGAAPAENIFKKVQQPMEQEIGLKLVLIPNGPFEALVDLDQGKVDAAAGGLAFYDWMALMKAKDYMVADKTAYQHRVIGKDEIRVVAHKEVGVKTLSKDQLKGLFGGTVTRWKDVGGPDLAVTVVYGTKIPGTQKVFQDLILDKAPYSQKVLEAGTAEEVKAKVMATPGALGLVPSGLADQRVCVPEIPEVARPITLVTKGAPGPLVVKLMDYINGNGKKYIAP